VRILHFSDVHVGVENYGHLNPNTGLSTRVEDFLATLDELVEFAISQDVDVVLFCGDAYKRRDPSQTHQREFASRIARIANEGIPVFLVVGNHDIPHIPASATALDIFPTLSVTNVLVADKLGTHRIVTRDGPLQVVGLPWIRLGGYMAREDTRNLTMEQINKDIQDRITMLLLNEIESLDPSIPAVLAAHVTLSTARTSSERSMMLGQDHILLQSTVAHPALDYVALGHVHKHQVLSFTQPMVVYSGSLERVDFSEEAEEKGFCVVDLDPSKVGGQRLTNFAFHPVKARPLITIDVDTTAKQEDPTEATLKAINRRYIRGAVIRVRVKLDVSQTTLFREEAVRKALEDSGAHHVVAIAREVTQERRTRLPLDAPEGLSTLQALRLYLESKRTPESQMNALLDRAQQLMHEENEGLTQT
jgi:exonuclease SbcD